MKFFILATATCVFSQTTSHCFAKCNSEDITCLSECFSIANPADVLAGPVADCSPLCPSNATDTTMCPHDCLKDIHSTISNNTASNNNSTHPANSTTKAAAPVKSANSTDSVSIVAPSNPTQNATQHPTSKAPTSSQSKVEAAVSGASLPTSLPILAALLAFLTFA